MKDNLGFIRRNLDLLVPLLALLMGILSLFLQGLTIQQAGTTIPMSQTFCGHYSYDRENWYPLDSAKKLSALEGDLYLRGYLEHPFPGNTRVYYYSNHIGTTLLIDGQQISCDLPGDTALQPEMCGSGWHYWYFGQPYEDATPVEIRLHNPHGFGNPNAYRDFLSTLCCSPNDSDYFQTYLEPLGRTYRIGGIVLLVTSILLLGSSLASSILSAPVVTVVPILGLLAGFTGGFFLFDSLNLSYSIDSNLLNTYGRQMCFMCTVYLLGMLAKESLHGTVKTVASAALTVSAVLNLTIVALCAANVMLIYDTLPYWFLSQCVLCPLLIGCCGAQLLQKKPGNSVVPVFLSVLLCLVLPTAAGLRADLYERGSLIKNVLILLFIYVFFRATGNTISNYKASARVRKLEKELEESRIAITLSQIQPHFIFNVLGTLRSLCREDPEQVYQGLGDFATYLRGNMNALTNTKFIPFEAELRHVDTYLRLEQLRLEDKLKICYDIQVRDFSIPPLTLQPLVENAVKHGIFYKSTGGTVTIRARQDGQRILLSVIDDGVGFGTKKPSSPFEQHAHVGLDNVRSRVEKMLQGTLRIDSLPDHGTTVTLEFPITELS